MKKIARCISIIILAAMLIPTLASCSVLFPKGEVYNIIYMQGNYSAAYAIAEAIKSGHETYVMLEKGSMASGIDKVERLHNIGFDTRYDRIGFSKADLQATIDTVKRLRKADRKAFFNFYCLDGAALSCAAIAANAGVDAENFHVYMTEDENGLNPFNFMDSDKYESGIYNVLEKGANRYFVENYMRGYGLSNKVDKIYDHYVSTVEEARVLFDGIMASDEHEYSEYMNAPLRTYNKNSIHTVEMIVYPSDEEMNERVLTDPLAFNRARAFALAALPNFSYRVSGEEFYQEYFDSYGKLKTKLETVMKLSRQPLEVELEADMVYKSVNEAVSELSDEAKREYYDVIYGDKSEAVLEVMARDEIDGEAVPEKKLVFFMNRLTELVPYASNAEYGIGGLEKNESIAMSYDELDAKYKNELLFASKEDYDLFLEAATDASLYDDTSAGLGLSGAQVKLFNIYIDYIYALKLTYYSFGSDYDIIAKAYSGEDIADPDGWFGTYKNSSGGLYCDYRKALSKLLLSFHEKDSVGRLIGRLSGEVRTCTVAYTGEDLLICGYSNMDFYDIDTSVGVLFLMCDTEEPLSLDKKSVTTARKLHALLRFKKNQMGFFSEPSIHINKLNLYSYSMKAYERLRNKEMRQYYKDMIKEYVKAEYPADASKPIEAVNLDKITVYDDGSYIIG